MPRPGDRHKDESLRVLVAQIGARRHYAVPAALEAAGVLERLVTTGCGAHPLVRAAAALPSRFLPGPMRRMTQRIVTGVPASKIASTLRFDLKRSGGARTAEERYAGYVRQNRAFGQHVCRGGFGSANAVYGFNAAAVEVFEAARKLGLSCFLDQTMAPFAYVETLLADERRRWPGWEEDVIRDAWRGLEERERREWELADVIVCGSPFVVESIEACGGPAEKCRVAEYGYPQSMAFPGPREPRTVAEGRPLNVLFAGTLSLRKGFPYVVEAARRLKGSAVTFRAVGPSEIHPAAVTEAREFVEIRGAVPRGEMPGHYAWADLLVVPSLAEGSANVAQEALAAGVPVIATAAAGTQVEESLSGRIVPAGDATALAEAIEAYRSAPAMWQAHSDRARQTQASSASASDYGQRLLSALNSARVLETAAPLTRPHREASLS